MDQEEYVEAVLAVVEQVPPGRVTTYGAVAAAVGQGGPRQVGRVMATYGGPVPWWRVVRADGTLPERHEHEALVLHRSEGTPLSGSGRVDMEAAFWEPGPRPGAQPEVDRRDALNGVRGRACAAPAPRGPAGRSRPAG